MPVKVIIVAPSSRNSRAHRIGSEWEGLIMAHTGTGFL